MAATSSRTRGCGPQAKLSRFQESREAASRATHGREVHVTALRGIVEITATSTLAKPELPDNAALPSEAGIFRVGVPVVDYGR